MPVKSENSSPVPVDRGEKNSIEVGPSGTESQDRLWELACRSRKIGRNDLAAKLFEAIIAQKGDANVIAASYLNLGQIAEHNQDYEAALDYYGRGLALKPQDRVVAYFRLARKEDVVEGRAAQQVAEGAGAAAPEFGEAVAPEDVELVAQEPVLARVPLVAVEGLDSRGRVVEFNARTIRQRKLVDQL